MRALDRGRSRLICRNLDHKLPPLGGPPDRRHLCRMSGRKGTGKRRCACSKDHSANSVDIVVFEISTSNSSSTSPPMLSAFYRNSEQGPLVCPSTHDQQCNSGGGWGQSSPTVHVSALRSFQKEVLPNPLGPSHY
eukprot:9105194-Pyramimonas_sp.AAC.5